MEVSTEKSTVMVNGTKEISVNVTVNGQPLEEVTGFKYLGATLSKDGTYRAEIRIWMATATAMNKLVFYAQSTITVISGRHSHSSDGQAEQDVEKQHQLPNQIPAVQVTGCLHPALRV